MAQKMEISGKNDYDRDSFLSFFSIFQTSKLFEHIFDFPIEKKLLTKFWKSKFEYSKLKIMIKIEHI